MSKTDHGKERLRPWRSSGYLLCRDMAADRAVCSGSAALGAGESGKASFVVVVVLFCFVLLKYS